MVSRLREFNKIIQERMTLIRDYFTEEFKEIGEEDIEEEEEEDRFDIFLTPFGQNLEKAYDDLSGFTNLSLFFPGLFERRA